MIPAIFVLLEFGSDS